MSDLNFLDKLTFSKWIIDYHFKYQFVMRTDIIKTSWINKSPQQIITAMVVHTNWVMRFSEYLYAHVAAVMRLYLSKNNDLKLIFTFF